MKILYKEVKPNKKVKLFNNYKDYYKYYVKKSNYYFKLAEKLKIFSINRLFEYSIIKLKKDYSPMKTRKGLSPTSTAYKNIIKGIKKHRDKMLSEKVNIKESILTEIKNKIDLKGYEVVLKKSRSY